MSTATLPKLASARAIAYETGLPLWRVYELVREDRIPHVRIGRAVRFDRGAVAAWIEAGGTGYAGPDAA